MASRASTGSGSRKRGRPKIHPDGKRRRSQPRWEQSEDALLKDICMRYLQAGDDLEELWDEIAQQIPRRDATQCSSRWKNMLNPDLVKGPWTKEEDELMIKLVRKYGPCNWQNIAKHLKGRIGKQCRERWHNSLDPNLKKDPWTDEEHRILEDAHARLGNK